MQLKGGMDGTQRWVGYGAKGQEGTKHSSHISGISNWMNGVE